VEVTTVNRADEEESELNREAKIYNAIDMIKLPAGCLLGYDLVQAGLDSPALKPLMNSIESWARENSDRARSEEVVRRFTAGGWIIELELFSGGDGVSEATGIGVAGMRGGLIAPHKDIRAALDRKSRWYGAMTAPYVIVVADAKNQLFGKEGVKDALTEAVFGDERTVFSGGQARRNHAKNGFWIGPTGVRNQHVSAVLLMPDAGIWKLRDKKWQPLLAINPWSNYPPPNVIKSLTRLEAEDQKWILRSGKSFGDILGFPMIWPPAD
jgi:hypothetical protein